VSLTEAHSLFILAGGGWVRVTLVWSDPAADDLVAHGDALVNNLDLGVSFTANYPTAEATDTYKGNAFYGMPDYSKDAADGYDKINNVEVRLPDNHAAVPVCHSTEEQHPARVPRWESGGGLVCLRTLPHTYINASSLTHTHIHTPSRLLARCVGRVGGLFRWCTSTAQRRSPDGTRCG
jgi:hypothetical protein